eukprot:scaffold58907_cov28-Tisochrysis_lutea.AAC.1
MLVAPWGVELVLCGVLLPTFPTYGARLIDLQSGMPNHARRCAMSRLLHLACRIANGSKRG